jgi:GT2 family glycosyltransferase
MKLSIILVEWNTSDLLKQTLESVYKENTGYDFEEIVIDNHSADDSVEMVKKFFPQVKLVANNDNRGFAKANNQGMAMAAGEYIMLLNTDVIVLDGAINKLVQFLDNHTDVMMVGPRLLNTDGTFQPACRRNLPNPVSSFLHLFGLAKIFKKSKLANEYKQTNADPEVTAPAQALSGAAMVFRRKVYEEIGGLDETFFMYGEDLDFCKRIFDKGWKAVYVSEAKITHLGGASSKKRRTKSLVNFYEAMWLYYKKHFYKQYNLLVNYIIWLGIKIRMMIALFINLFK